MKIAITILLNINHATRFHESISYLARRNPSEHHLLVITPNEASWPWRNGRKRGNAICQLCVIEINNRPIVVILSITVVTLHSPGGFLFPVSDGNDHGLLNGGELRMAFTNGERLIRKAIYYFNGYFFLIKIWIEPFKKEYRCFPLNTF